MNLKLKEHIINKAYEQNAIEPSVWNDSSFKDIENHLLSYFEFNGELDEEAQNKFIDKLYFETNKGKYIKDNYDYLYSSHNELIDELVFCETVDELINSILDGYGMVLNNDVIAWVDII